MNDTTNTIHCLAGSVVAGCFSTVLGHSLDTIKVNQQTKPEFSRASSFQVAKSLAKNGKGMLFYKGIGPPMANQIIMNSIMFYVFGKVKYYVNQSPWLDENTVAMCAGLFSGFATACLSTPSDWLKIQAQVSLNEKGKQENMISILKRHGMKGDKFRLGTIISILYRGHVANLTREGVFTMVYLGLYDRISNTIRNDSSNQSLDSGSIIMISAFTGACAWICNYPFDTVKSVIQASKPIERKLTMTSAVRFMYKSGGIRSLFLGVGPSTFRAMLVTSSRMVAYEKTIQLISSG